MSSGSSSARPSGCISIPIEIVSSSDSNFRHDLFNQRIRNQKRTTPNDTIRYKMQSKNLPIFNHEFTPVESDFIQLNEFSDRKKSSPINSKYLSDQQSYYRVIPVTLNEYPVPINNKSHDRSHSPVSQYDDLPTRPPQPTSQQHQYSDFIVTKNVPSTTTQTSAQSNDQQVPSADNTNNSNSNRDPNIVALEKLEQIKQSLIDLNQQVDTITVLTRDNRIYKELDEQALKLMIRCDELIDVSADVKEKRKEMIQNVQMVLAKLESRVPVNSAIEDNSNNNNTNDTTSALVDDSSTTQIEPTSTEPSA